jgi:hypothetical protein
VIHFSPEEVFRQGLVASAYRISSQRCGKWRRIMPLLERQDVIGGGFAPLNR